MKNQYEKEVKQRWGETSAYKEYRAHNTDIDKALLLLEAVLEGFAEHKRSGASPDSELAKIQVKKLKQCITENFYTCTPEILAGLGQMYVADERFRNNIDRHGEGTADYISRCILNCV